MEGLILTGAGLRRRRIIGAADIVFAELAGAVIGHLRLPAMAHIAFAAAALLAAVRIGIGAAAGIAGPGPSVQLLHLFRVAAGEIAGLAPGAGIVAAIGVAVRRFLVGHGSRPLRRYMCPDAGPRRQVPY